jgi:TonB-linked SusC/RagA family outer membrane protein
MDYMNRLQKYTAICLCCLASLTIVAAQEYQVALPADSMGEKISMGFYSLPKITNAGAYATVSGEVLSKSPVANLSQTLAGRLTGLSTLELNSELTKAGIAKIIRGNSTINGSDPLIIVDGIICPNTNIEFIPTEEIESISILKDGSTTAIYGIQGAIGAIVITTKRGYLGPKKVNVYFDQSFQQMTKRPQLSGSAEYAALRNEAGLNDGLRPYSQFSGEQIANFTAGTDPLYPNNDWYNRYVSDLTCMQRAGLSVQGGNDRLKYFSALNYLHQTSPFIVTDEPGRKYNPTPEVNWANIRTNVDVKFNEYLSAFLLLNGYLGMEKTTRYSNADIYGRIFNLPPTMYGPLTPEEIDDDGIITPESNQVVTHDAEDHPAYGMLNRSGYTRNLSTTIQAQTGITVDMSFLTKGLSLTGLMAYQTYGVNSTATHQDYERYVRYNDWSRLRFTKFKTYENTPLGYAKGSSFFYNLNLSVRANYEHTFNDHFIQAMAFYYYSKQEKQSLSGSGILPYLNETVGLTALYGYRNKYFIKGDIGYSGSEQFHPDHRYTATPAISASWIVTNEDFLSTSNLLDFLKLRASYAINANDQLGGDRFLFADDIRSDGNEGLRGNPNLSAEIIKKQNYGLDLRFLKDFSLSADYFTYRCDNLLVSSALIPEYQTVPLQYYPKLNNGKMQNKGIEIELGYDKQISDELLVFAKASYTLTRNKILKVNELPYPDRAYPLRSEGFKSGQPWGYLIDYSNGNGMFNSEEEMAACGLTYSAMVDPRVGDFIYLDLNNNGVIEEGDLAPIGYPRVPEIYYTISGGLEWKNFEFNFLLQGTANTSVTVSGVGAYEYAAQGVFTDLHKNAWTPERYSSGAKIDYPALSLTQSANHVSNSFFIMDASYLKLRNVELSYTLPERICKKIQTEKIRLFLSGQNLITFDWMRSEYIDPEVGTMAAFQPYRIYNIGLNLTF